MGCMWPTITVTAISNFNYLCIFPVEAFKQIVSATECDLVPQYDVKILAFLCHNSGENSLQL